MIEALALLVVLPITFAILATLSVAAALASLPLGWVFIAATSMLVPAYLTTGRAMMRFIYAGPGALQELGKFWCLPGLVSVGIGFAALWAFTTQSTRDETALMLTVLLLGLPLILPIAHLLLERQLRPNANEPKL